jgi:cyclohexyl-isocyanide hydratase
MVAGFSAKEQTMSTSPFRIGFLLFPNLTQLDLTGPFEVLSKVPDSEVHLVWKSHEPVRDNSGLQMLPTTTFADCPALDIVCVPGGPGVSAVMEDEEALGFLRRQAAGARYVTSVCTGSLVLAAAGLLKGKRAACHWMSRELLKEFGAIPVAERVVRDGNVISGGGVTAGIDFGLTVLAEVAGRELAELVQLRIEYNPQPPFTAGSPERAPPAVLDRLATLSAPLQQARLEQARRLGAKVMAAG